MPQVIYHGSKSEAERIQDRLNNVHGPLRPNSTDETVPTRCITNTYWAAGHVPAPKYGGPDEVAATGEATMSTMTNDAKRRPRCSECGTETEHVCGMGACAEWCPNCRRCVKTNNADPAAE